MSSAILSVTAVAVSFFTLVVTLVFAVQQIRVMRQTNQMPIFIDMIREFRSEEFQRAEQYVLHRLESENSPDSGILGLQNEARIAATTVQSFFGVLGDLVMRGIISEEAAVSTLGFRASNLWASLEPFITAERESRGDNDFACYFEDLVSRVRPNWPPEKYYGRTRRRIDVTNSGSAERKAIPSRLDQEKWMKLSTEQRKARVIAETIRSGTAASPGLDVRLGKIGVRVRCGDVRQIGSPWKKSRYLGPLTGACAGTIDTKASTGNVMQRAILGDKITNARTVFIVFANGRRYERHLYWGTRAPTGKLAKEVSSFNTMADKAG